MLKDALGLYAALPSDIQFVVDQQMGDLWRAEYDRCLAQIYCAASLMCLRRRLRRDVDQYEDTLYKIIRCGGECNRRNAFPHAFLVLSGLSASVMRTLGMYPTCLKRRCILISKWVLLSARGALLAGVAMLLSDPPRRTIRAYDIHKSQCVAWRNRLTSFVDGMAERGYVGIDVRYMIEVSMLRGCFRRMQRAFARCKLRGIYETMGVWSFFARSESKAIHHV